MAFSVLWHHSYNLPVPKRDGQGRLIATIITRLPCRMSQTFSLFPYGQNGTPWQMSNIVLERDAWCCWWDGCSLKKGEVGKKCYTNLSTLSGIDEAKDWLCNKVRARLQKVCDLMSHLYWGDRKTRAGIVLSEAQSCARRGWQWHSRCKAVQMLAPLLIFFSFILFFTSVQ